MDHWDYKHFISNANVTRAQLYNVKNFIINPILEMRTLRSSQLETILEYYNHQELEKNMKLGQLCSNKCHYHGLRALQKPEHLNKTSHMETSIKMIYYSSSKNSLQFLCKH